MSTLRHRLIRLAYADPAIRTHLLPLIREATTQEAQKKEVLNLLSSALFGAEEIEGLSKKLEGDEPLTAQFLSDLTSAAERRVEDAEYEVRTSKIPEHREDNREDRDHYRKVLKAIQKLKPTA